LEGIVKGWAVALAVAVSALVLASIFIPFQTPTSNNRANEQDDLIAATSGSQLREILLVANEEVLKVAPDNELYPEGLWYNAMTFNGTIPGPFIVANQGDTLRITLNNEGSLVHSLNFHAGFGPSHALSGVVSPGESKTWTMKVDYPGAFLYHCDGDNLNGIWEHIADGMYGGIVIRAKGDEPAKKEFFVSFSELYHTKSVSALPSYGSSPNVSKQSVPGSFDMNKFADQKPDLILTNGMAFRYIPWIGTEVKIPLNSNAETFHVKVGELTRWYLFNAGPRNDITFNFGAGLVKEVLYNSNSVHNGSSDPSLSSDSWNTKGYDEVVNIPPGSGTIIEVTFPESGLYFGNDHDVGSILNGAGFVVMAE
jgi:nitrite reductase (NO-forming)